MTPEQKAAFVNAQTALMLCDLAGMQAENDQRKAVGSSMAYPEEAFVRLNEAWAPVLGRSALFQLFNFP